MHPGVDGSDERAWRHRALLLMLARRGADAERLRALHPDAADLAVAGGEAHDLGELLWDELEDLERRRLHALENHTPAERRCAVGFFLRRRSLDRYALLHEAASHLPEPWPHVLRMGPEELVLAGRELGIVLLAAAYVHQDAPHRQELLDQLTTQQRRDLQRAVRAGAFPEHDARLVQLWLEGYRYARGARGDKKAVEILGRLVFGMLFHRLTKGQQDEALRCSKTTFCARVRELPALELPGEDDVAALQRLARVVVERHLAAVEAGHEPPRTGAG